MGRRGRAALAAIVVTTVTVAAPVVANASDAPATNEATDPAARETRADTELILLPTHVIADGSSQWIRVAQTLDAFLTDTAQDLGLTVALQDSSGKHHVGEADLPQLASEHGSLVLLPVVRVGKNTDTVALRLSLARPGTRVLVTRVAEANADSLEVRAAVMLRDLRRAARAAGEDIPDDRTPTTALPVPAHSPGRAILATNGTLYGAFVGYSLQRSSASDDPRLLYPLLAVGAGVGLGGAIIIADEWDVGVGEAWYLAAGAWWPAVAGHLIHEGRFGDAPGASADEAWSFGLAASVTGVALSSVGLLPYGMGDGGAVLAHSGGGLGMIVGGLSEFAYEGEVGNEIPHGGMGFGAAAGWLVGSAAAISLQPKATQVLTIDLGLVLGGLAGASAASPLLFDDVTAEKTRGWVGATGGAMLIGGGLAWYLAEDDAPAQPSATPHGPSRGKWVAQWSLPKPTVVRSAATGRSALGVGFDALLW